MMSAAGAAAAKDALVLAAQLNAPVADSLRLECRGGAAAAPAPAPVGCHRRGSSRRLASTAVAASSFSSAMSAGGEGRLMCGTKRTHAPRLTAFARRGSQRAARALPEKPGILQLLVPAPRPAPPARLVWNASASPAFGVRTPKARRRVSLDFDALLSASGSKARADGTRERVDQVAVEGWSRRGEEGRLYGDAAACEDGERQLRHGHRFQAPSTLPGAPPSIGPGNQEYLPFKIPFKMIMGVEPLNSSDWFEVDVFYQQEMVLRWQILARHRDAVIARLPGSEAANRELLELMAEHLPSRFPHMFTRTGSTLRCVVTGEAVDLSDAQIDPLEAAARLVQEDLCIMMETEKGSGQYVFVSGAVLFPNGWDLREKLGQSTAAIHEPVPLYADKISRRVDAFMRKLTVEKPFWRANWTITDDPSLFRPLTEGEYARRVAEVIGSEGGNAQASAAETDRIELLPTPEPASVTAPMTVSVETAGDLLFTRSERETFVRFPRTNAVLFTIRTLVKPLKIFKGRPELAAECVAALDQLPDSMVQYKMLGRVKDVARAYLLKCTERQ